MFRPNRTGNRQVCFVGVAWGTKRQDGERHRCYGAIAASKVVARSATQRPHETRDPARTKRVETPVFASLAERNPSLAQGYSKAYWLTTKIKLSGGTLVVHCTAQMIARSSVYAMQGSWCGRGKWASSWMCSMGRRCIAATCKFETDGTSVIGSPNVTRWCFAAGQLIQTQT